MAENGDGNLYMRWNIKQNIKCDASKKFAVILEHVCDLMSHAQCDLKYVSTCV